jgi:transcription initiation factor TFIID subunit 2
MAPLETAATLDDASTGSAFQLVRQKIELDVSFCPRQITGKTTLELQPEKAQLREIVLSARQLTPTRITIQGKEAAFQYSNLHKRLTLFPGTGLEQYHHTKERIKRHVEEGEDELVIFLPNTVDVREVRPADAGEGGESQGTSFAPLSLEIEYVLDDFRDALHFVGVEDGDARFPHVYTRNSPFPGTASCLFPCIDDGETRFSFEVSINYPRTVGDALRKPLPATTAPGDDKADSVMTDVDDDRADLTEEERAMDMQVVCSGYLTDNVRSVRLESGPLS